MSIDPREWNQRWSFLKKCSGLNGLSPHARGVIASQLQSYALTPDGQFNREGLVKLFSGDALSCLKYRGLGMKCYIQICQWLGLEPNPTSASQHWMRGLSTRLQSALLCANLQSIELTKEALISGEILKKRNIGKGLIAELKRHLAQHECKCPKCGYVFSLEPAKK